MANKVIKFCFYVCYYGLDKLYVLIDEFFSALFVSGFVSHVSIYFREIGLHMHK